MLVPKSRAGLISSSFFFLSLISTISFVVFINARIASIYSRKLDGFIFGLWESENTTYVLMTGREE